MSTVPDGSWPVGEAILGMTRKTSKKGSAGASSVRQSPAKRDSVQRSQRGGERPIEGMTTRRRQRVATPPLARGGMSIRNSPPRKRQRAQMVESESSDEGVTGDGDGGIVPSPPRPAAADLGTGGAGDHSGSSGEDPEDRETLSSRISRQGGTLRPQHEVFGEGTSSPGRRERLQSPATPPHMTEGLRQTLVPEPTPERPSTGGVEGGRLAGKAPAQPSSMPPGFFGVRRGRRIIRRAEE